MKVYIVGYMGVGKTSIGKRLGSALGLPFIDLDAQIIARTNQSIPSIFKSIGERGFRQMEMDVLRSISDNEFVLSTGGGTPCQNENMEFMRSAGLVIWLKLPPEILVTRLKPTKAKRPLIADVADEDLLFFIDESLKLRIPFYTQAHIHFNALNFDSHRLGVLVEKVNSYSK